MPDIIEKLNQKTDLSIFTDALRTAHLDKTLHMLGPFTVFAPNNSAFSRLPAGTLDDLMNNLSRLESILKNHIVSGLYTSDDLSEKDELIPIEGESIGLGPEAGKRMTISSFVDTDIEAENGIIHIIDIVLMPIPQART